MLLVAPGLPLPAGGGGLEPAPEALVPGPVEPVLLAPGPVVLPGLLVLAPGPLLWLVMLVVVGRVPVLVLVITD